MPSLMLDLNDFPTPAWRRAIAFFDDGDPSKVAELLLSGEPQHLHVRQFLAKVVTGERKPPVVGKARRLLTIDYKDYLKMVATNIQCMGKAWTAQEKEGYKADAILRVAALSGASVVTVKQAWKQANSRWVALARKNKAFIRPQRASTTRVYRNGKLYTPRIR
jgi:hypothetical protein